MKRIHIVDPYGSAAMNRMVQPFVQWFPSLYEVTTSAEVDKDADLNMHIPWHTLVGLEDKGDGKHVIAYTHVNAGSEHLLADACNRADLITCMTFRGRDELLEMGVDPKKIWTIYCAADQFKYRKRLIGVIGYPQPNGRKREGLLLDLAWNYDMTPYNFILTGAGWEGMTERLNALGVSCQWHHADTFEKLSETLSLLDVLLVTGYREGGPLPLLECMRSGAPVLSPDFGYAADLLDESQIYTSNDDLMSKLGKLFKQNEFNHMLASAWSWSDYAAEHALLFGRLLGESVDLFPERGMSRYAQLLDIIDEVKPERIIEIGTWNGNRAIQMIQQASKYRDDVKYYGYDLFETQTTRDFVRELSKIGQEEAIVKKRLDATGARIELHKGDTRRTLNSGLLPLANFIFVDGGHSEKTIQNDGTFAMSRLLKDEVAVFDDYYHEGQPEGMGCNKFIDAIDRNEFEVTHLPARTETDDGRLVGMVKVKRADISIQMQNESRTDTLTSC